MKQLTHNFIVSDLRKQYSCRSSLFSCIHFLMLSWLIRDNEKGIYCIICSPLRQNLPIWKVLSFIDFNCNSGLHFKNPSLLPTWESTFLVVCFLCNTCTQDLDFILRIDFFFNTKTIYIPEITQKYFYCCIFFQQSKANKCEILSPHSRYQGKADTFEKLL